MAQLGQKPHRFNYLDFLRPWRITAVPWRKRKRVSGQDKGAKKSFGMPGVSLRGGGVIGWEGADPEDTRGRAAGFRTRRAGEPAGGRGGLRHRGGSERVADRKSTRL